MEDQAFVEIHPEDATRLGLSDATRARVRTSAGEVELTVRVTEHIANGAAFVPYNQPGFAANTLLSGSLVTAVDLEPVAAGVPA